MASWRWATILGTALCVIFPSSRIYCDAADLCLTVKTCEAYGASTCTTNCPPCLYTYNSGYSCFDKSNNACPFSTSIASCDGKGIFTTSANNSTPNPSANPVANKTSTLPTTVAPSNNISTISPKTGNNSTKSSSSRTGSSATQTLSSTQAGESSFLVVILCCVGGIFVIVVVGFLWYRSRRNQTKQEPQFTNFHRKNKSSNNKDDVSSLASTVQADRNPENNYTEHEVMSTLRTMQRSSSAESILSIQSTSTMGYYSNSIFQKHSKNTGAAVNSSRTVNSQRIGFSIISENTGEFAEYTTASPSMKNNSSDNRLYWDDTPPSASNSVPILDADFDLVDIVDHNYLNADLALRSTDALIEYQGRTERLFSDVSSISDLDDSSNLHETEI